MFEPSKVIETLREIEERLAAAGVQGDRLVIEQTLADDWSVTDLTGQVLTKAEVLKEVFGSGNRHVVSMQIDDLNVRPFGDWAILTGRTNAAGEYQGEVTSHVLPDMQQGAEERLETLQDRNLGLAQYSQSRLGNGQ